MHPFVRKAKGPNILSDLVSESMDGIERWRRSEQEAEQALSIAPMDTMVRPADQNQDHGDDEESNSGTMINYNTVIQREGSDDEEEAKGTMIVKYDSRGSSNEYNRSNQSGTVRQVEDTKQDDEPYFMKCIKEMESARAGMDDDIENMHPDIPPELQGMSAELLEKMMKRLDIDMEAEITAVRARYSTRR
jgi:hypothetical protein